MTLVLYLLIVSYLQSVSTTAGIFDLAEYRRVSYDANIGEDFLWFAPDLDIRDVTTRNIDELEKRIAENIPDESLPNYVFVTSKGGQKFACSLPDVEDLKKPKPPRSSKNPKIYGDALAASFYIEKCIKLRGNHWWSYILCRGNLVEQVHGERGQEGYVKNILGIFDGNLTMPSYQESTEDRLLYVEESYSSGTFCDLDDYREPRSTTVRYECDPQLSTNEALLSSVVEVRPCQYLMTVKVGTLCHYPEFLPTNQANSKSIGCQPYMTRKDVRELLERQLEEKKKKEEAKRHIADARIEFNSALEKYVAMSKSARKMNNDDDMKKTNAEMDYNAAHFNLLVANLEAEGEPLSKKKLDTMWKLFTSTDISDFMFYSHYDSIKDENRGNLWHYFHDPLWPKDYFPKDITYVAIQNAYIDEVTLNLQSSYEYDYDKRGVVEGISKFLKTGKIELETNAVIPAMEVFEEIVDMSVDFAHNRYPWLHSFHLAFLDDRDEPDVFENLLNSIINPKKGLEYFTLGRLARGTVSLMFDDIWSDLLDISKNGEKSKVLNVDSSRYKAIYQGLKIEPIPANRQIKKGEHTLKYNISVVEEDTGIDMELEYMRLLTPLYKLLSISWFRRENPYYFHVSPVSEAYLKKVGSEDYIFHKNLARDMSYFAGMLSYITLKRVSEFEAWRDGKKSKLISADQLESYLMTRPLKLLPEAVEAAEFALYYDVGPDVVKTAKQNIWMRKIEKYTTSFWIKDHKLRKQAQSMQSMMKDLLSVKDDSAAFVSLGGKTGSQKKKKKELIDEKMLNKMLSMDSLDDLEDVIENLKELATSATSDDDFSDLDEMEHVLDLLEKAGLSKKTDVQIKLFDADGNEIQSEELDAVARSILDSSDSVNRFKDIEKAYNRKLGKDSEEEEEEDD
ncbi:hypothetical protein B9Z55_009495 [Caenorhabditis nigoni]|uniref:MRH domain-containing protein n=1 Tax=Caenorhabditis nigoni TaxID=1611254 RepID=A0A2G5USG7_9PELO|nr:hypothetical protein B9Z55_009495 [Caenorhabditis nigoni]